MNTDETDNAAQSGSSIATCGSTEVGCSCLSDGYGLESNFLKLKHLIKDMIFWDFASGCLSPVLMMDEYTDGKLKQYFSYFTGFSQCYPLFHNETKRKLG